MAVYIDDMSAKYGHMLMCHMVADTEDELKEMATKIGVNLKWWQYKGSRKTHFDICKSKRALAKQYGAIEISVHELGCMLKHRAAANDPLPKPRGLHQQSLL